VAQSLTCAGQSTACQLVLDVYVLAPSRRIPLAERDLMLQDIGAIWLRAATTTRQTK
jgi:hypothetical protein